jgi:hypothetical protein
MPDSVSLSEEVGSIHRVLPHIEATTRHRILGNRHFLNELDVVLLRTRRHAVNRTTMRERQRNEPTALRQRLKGSNKKERTRHCLIRSP